LPTLPSLPKQVDPDGPLASVDRQAFARKVDAHGCVQVDLQTYYIKQELSGHYVVLFVNAQSRAFDVSLGSRQIKQVLIKGLQGEIMPFDRYVDLMREEARSEARQLQMKGSVFRVYALGRSPPAFHLTPGTHRSRCWPRSRRGRGGETTGGAIVWAAGLEAQVERGAYLGSGSRLGRTMMGPAKETQPRKRVQEDTQEQKNGHVMRHTDPHEGKCEEWEA
jgi:hypothetical protein